MSNPDRTTGDHLKIGPSNERVVEANVPARQAVTGHHVRAVLICSLLGAVIALIAVYAFEVL